MKVLRAHGLFASRGRPPDLDIFVGIGETFDAWAAAATALAYLSGWLPDCRTYKDLVEAMRHGQALVNSEVIGERRLRRTVLRVVQAVLRYGERVTGGGPCSGG